MASRETLRRAIDRHVTTPLGEALVGRGLGPYRGYAEVLQAIDRRVVEGARLTQIGRSVCDEPLFALHFGTAEPTQRTRTCVVLSGLHPMEWIGIETHLALTHRLLRAELGERAVICVPVVNPDGMLRVEEHLRAGRHRFVRHNARGVDLNRNFDARWGRQSMCIRFIPWLFRPGSHPASEPEVAALAYTLGARRVDRALSLHSSGGAVLYPSAHSLRPIADGAEHQQWARFVAQRTGGQVLRTMRSAWFSRGLTQGGLEIDWFHERHGALSLLVECPSGGIALRPSRLVEPFAWLNPPRPREMATRLAEALEPFVRGDRVPPAR